MPAGQTGALAREHYGPVGAYSGGAADDLAVNVFQYYRILIRRKWLIGSVAIASVALGALATLMTMPLYTAAVRLQIERNVSKIVESGYVTPVEGSDVEFLRTQYELLQSRSVAERAASALKLADDREFFQPRGVSVIGAMKGAVNNILGSTTADVGTRGDRAAAEHWAASIILANRAVRPIAGSRLVDVMYSDPVPARAQRIAGGIADAFIAANLDKRFQANAYAKTFLEDQLKQLKLRLEESERVVGFCRARADYGHHGKVVRSRNNRPQPMPPWCAGLGAHEERAALKQQIGRRHQSA